MAKTEWQRGPAIGQGSTATIFLATSSSPPHIFAVKSAKFSHSLLLQHEKRILSTLNSPYIIPCFGSSITPQKSSPLFYNLFLEYFPNGSLADNIKLSKPTIPLITHDILAGLAYLHNRGIAHCDIKPENILLARGGRARAKICDFGCARWVADCDRTIRGTPAYMAPETLRGEEQGMLGDVWSLGCIVVEMLTGRRWPEIVDVWSGDTPEIPGWVSEDARDFLGKCLREGKEERWTAEMLLRHDFVAGGGGGSWVSPKSCLDFGFWEKVEDENEDEEEDGMGEGCCGEEMVGRIWELAAVSGGGCWDWREDWWEVRVGFWNVDCCCFGVCLLVV